MGLKKRLTTFVSNWLGVIIAAIIVLLSTTFGGMYLYGRSRIDNTVNFVTQVINLRFQDGLVKTGVIDEPPGHIFHLVLQVYNPYGDSVDISVSNITLVANSYTFPVSQNGSWDKTVPTGYAIFEGDLIIDDQTFSDLVAKGPVEVDIKGAISGSGQYKWIKRQSQRSINIRIPGVIFRLDPVSGPNGTN